MVRRFQMTSKGIPHDASLSMLNASFGVDVVNFFDFLCAIKSIQPRRTLDDEFSRLLSIIAVVSGVMLIVCISAPVIIRQCVICCQNRSRQTENHRNVTRPVQASQSYQHLRIRNDR